MPLVCIATFPSPVEASIARGMLAGHSIPAILDGATILGVIPMPASIGGVRMMVHDHDATEALRLLREHGDIT